MTNNNAIGVRHVDLSTHRTPAHVLLKWGLQQGVAVIPKASSEARIESNPDLFDFELSADHLVYLDAVEKQKYCWDSEDVMF